MKKVLDRLTAIFIILFLLLGFGWMYIHPDEINRYENRYAYKAPALTVKAYLDGDFQTDFDAALTDQTPFALAGKRYYNEFSTRTLQKVIQPILGQEQNRYVSVKSIFAIGDYLVNKPSALSEQKAGLDARTENINTIIAAHPELDFYGFYVERDMDIDFETGEKTGAAEYVRDSLDLLPGHFDAFSVDSFKDYSECFYKTDHHWNANGSYQGYRLAAKMLGVSENELLSPVGEPVDTGKLASGSKAATVGAKDVMTEPFSVLRFDFPALDITVNGKSEADYGGGEASITSDSPTISYGTYYGGDNGETVFDAHQPGKGNLLIIGDSYDNAILKLLAGHFDKTYAVDLRNYEAQMGSPFRFSQYTRQHNISKVLFIGCNSYYTSADFTVEG